MAPAALAYTYCTQQDIEHLLSAMGVLARLDDDEDGRLDSEEQAALTDAITEASETINFYCWFKYDPLALSQSNWVSRKATVLAAYRICGRRGNPPPEIIVEDAAKAEEDLKAVADGPRMIPAANLRRSLCPVWSQTRVDPRYTFRCIRVERNNSAQHNKTGLQQNTDYTEAYIDEIH